MSGRDRHISLGLAMSAFAVSLWVPVTLATAQTADMILVNGKIVTLDSKSTVTSALAIEGGTIAAVGNDGPAAPPSCTSSCGG